MKKLLKTIFTLSLVAVSVFASLSQSVSAQSTNLNAAQGMQISPALVELNAVRNKTYTINLNILNVTAYDLDYSVSIEDFSASDETGSPKILIDEALPSSISMKDWFSHIEKFKLNARQSQKISFNINIPDNAEAGGHYGVLRFSGTAPEIESTGVGLSASAGVLILVRVDGDVKEEANLASFLASSNGKQPILIESGPITFITRIKNIGNVHVKPVGNIELRDIFGNLLETMPVNENKSNVLPNSTRRFESEYKKTWMFGRYSASLTLGYGTTGQAITKTIHFWVLPYKLILSIVLIGATILFILSKILKMYNRHIIEKIKNEEAKNKKKTNKKS